MSFFLTTVSFVFLEAFVRPNAVMCTVYTSYSYMTHMALLVLLAELLVLRPICTTTMNPPHAQAG
eukprot:m.14149 g.14149  ORF g.14149 m.14149 type:complete len:65 (-) comp6148_c0_seq1:16-210(-)